MNKAYYLNGRYVYIYDDNNIVIERKNKNNIEQILISENNIEELEELVEEFDTKIFDINQTKSLYVFIMLFCFISAIILSSVFILFSVIRNSSLIISLILSSIPATIYFLFGIRFIKDLKIELAEEKSYTIALSKVKEQLEKEKIKLKKLEINSRVVSSERTIPKIINISDKLKVLKDKLMVIESYSLNKKEHVKFYKTGKIQELMELYNYNESDIEFIKFLIEEELKNSTCKGNIKRKTKK